MDEWRNAERMFNSSHGSMSGCKDQYINMVWEGEWTLAEPRKKKHNKAAL